MAQPATAGSGRYVNARTDRGAVARTVFDAWLASVVVLDDHGRIEAVNAAWERFARENGGFGVGVGANYFEVCERAAAAEPAAAATLQGLHRVLAGSLQEYSLEYPCHSAQEQRWFRLDARTVTIDGHTRLLVIHEDISTHKRMQDDVRARSLLLDEVDAAVIATDLDGLVTLWNRAAERLYGWPADEAVGQSIDRLTLPADGQAASKETHDRLVRGKRWEGQFTVARADGSTFPAYLRNAVVEDDDGQPTGIVSVSVDLSARVAMEGQLARSNRELKAITNSIGDGLCTLDADGRITYLNPEAQRLLGVYVTEALGVRFSSWMRTDGDEQIGLAALSSEGPVECLLIRGDGRDLPIECVGTPLVATNDPEPTGWVVIFRDITERRERETRMEEQVEQAKWLGRIRDALDDDGFVLHAQPIVDLTSGEVVQHELLIRMRDPENPDAVIAPGRFLPVAEELGLAPAIDRWVLRRGLEIAAAGLPVQINLSATSLDDPTLPHLIEQLLTETGADPSTVMFELTETALLNSEATAERFAIRVHELGFHLALDDFGTGYGGFTYLKHLPIDELKIDIEFVRDAKTDPASRHVIQAVVSLARAFGLRTVAEGVEDTCTLDVLRELQVDLVQGYGLGRPRPVEEVLANAAGKERR